MRGHVLLGLTLAACGRVGFDGRPDAPDPLADAPKLDTPFGPPIQLTALGSTFEEDDPSMTDDLLEIYFASDRLGSEQVFRSTRAAPTDPWGPVTHLPALDLAGSYINHPSVAPDGLSIYFASDRGPSAGGTDLWVATRPDRTSAWDLGQPLPALASPQDEGDPVIGDTWIYFTSNRAGTSDTYVAYRASPGGPFGAPALVPSLSSNVFDSGVWVDVTQLLSCFASQRGGIADELYCATREATHQEFGAWMPIAELNTAQIDQDPWLSSDLRTIVFSSYRSGDHELYMATR